MVGLVIMRAFVVLCLFHCVLSVRDENVLNRLLKGTTSDKHDSIVGILKQIKNVVVTYQDLPLCFQGNESSPMKMRNAIDPVTLVNDKLDQVAKDTQQKLELALETISAIRLITSSQSSQMDDLRSRLQNLEKQGVSEQTIPEKNPIPIDSYMTKDTVFAADSPAVIYMTPMGDEIDEPLFEKHLKEAVQKMTKEIATLNIDLASQSVQLHKLQEFHDSANRTHPSCSCPVDNLQSILEAIKKELTTFEKTKDDIEGEKSFIEDLTMKVKLLEQRVDDQSNVMEEISNLKVENKKLREDLKTVLLRETAFNQSLEKINKSLSYKMQASPTQNRRSEQPHTNSLCVWPYKKAAGSCYHVVSTERLTWMESRTKCQELQGDLAVPVDMEKFKQHLLSLRLSRSYSFWIGASDAVIESTWKWIDGTRVQPEMWASGKPRGDESSNCMELLPSLKFAASDTGCSQRRYFICEQQG